MSVGKLVVDKHWMGAVFVLETLPHVLYFVIWHFQAWPAIPLEASRLAKATQPSHEAARGHGKGVAAIVGAFDGDGQTVGEQQQASWCGRRLAVGRSRHFAAVGRWRLRMSKTLSGFGDAGREETMLAVNRGSKYRSLQVLVVGQTRLSSFTLRGVWY